MLCPKIVIDQLTPLNITFNIKTISTTHTGLIFNQLLFTKKNSRVNNNIIQYEKSDEFKIRSSK